jgi:hypothetical protein
MYRKFIIAPNKRLFCGTEKALINNKNLCNLHSLQSNNLKNLPKQSDTLIVGPFKVLLANRKDVAIATINISGLPNKMDIDEINKCIEIIGSIVNDRRFSHIQLDNTLWVYKNQIETHITTSLQKNNIKINVDDVIADISRDLKEQEHLDNHLKKVNMFRFIIGGILFCAGGYIFHK